MKLKNHYMIMRLWGDDKPYKALAADLYSKSDTEAEKGRKLAMCKNWWQRGQISCECYLMVEMVAKKRDFPVDLEVLHRTR